MLFKTWNQFFSLQFSVILDMSATISFLLYNFFPRSSFLTLYTQLVRVLLSLEDRLHAYDNCFFFFSLFSYFKQGAVSPTFPLVNGFPEILFLLNFEETFILAGQTRAFISWQTSWCVSTCTVGSQVVEAQLSRNNEYSILIIEVTLIV